MRITVLQPDVLRKDRLAEEYLTCIHFQAFFKGKKPGKIEKESKNIEPCEISMSLGMVIMLEISFLARVHQIAWASSILMKIAIVYCH